MCYEDLGAVIRYAMIEIQGSCPIFFRALNRIAGQEQRLTLAYRPQAYAIAERMVQTLTRALKMYVTNTNQKDWDEYAERLTFAIITAQDRKQGDTPFYLIHG